MRRLPAITLFLFLAAAVNLQPASAQELLRLSDHQRVALRDVMPDLTKSRIIFVGESHDSKADHAAQLKIIRALKEAGVPVAIGLEMFRKSSQGELDRWTAGRMPEAEFNKVFKENWGDYWPLYTDIAGYARDNKIPMVGLNISREIIQQVASQGFSSLSPEQATQLPDVQCNVSPEYRDFIRQAFGAHHHSESSFTHFCEAQLVWDTAMAANLIDFLNAHPSSTMVVLAGNGHAWKPGVPEQVKKQSSQIPFRVILPEIPGQLESGAATARDADYLVLRGDGETNALD